jgi:hypothetical protein
MPPLVSPATSIDEVIEQLDRIVSWARATHSRQGLFPALYRKVTIGVRDGIAQGVFDDGARMARLDVIFANRYLDAFAARHGSQPMSRAWRAAFEAADQFWPTVIQHLLLGINAHINLDLGIAAADTAPGRDLPGMERDFNRINAILASLVEHVQQALCEIWPLMRVIDWAGGPHDEAIVHFSIERARAEAWAVATRLATVSDGDRAAEIDRTDLHTAGLASRVRNPGPLLELATKLVRLGEIRSVPRILDLLG